MTFSLHEGTGGTPITVTSFRPITREILGGLVRDRCGPLGHVHRAVGVQDPLCDAAPTDNPGTVDHLPQGAPKVVVPESVSA